MCGIEGVRGNFRRPVEANDRLCRASRPGGEGALWIDAPDESRALGTDASQATGPLITYPPIRFFTTSHFLTRTPLP
jgi:hypothetical protein